MMFCNRKDLIMKNESKQKSRRMFIKNMALAGGAGVLMTNPARAIAAGLGKNPLGKSETRCSQGYRLTPHIRKYYKTTAS